MIWPEPAPARPLWLVTLADLALLLIGFLVLLYAARDPRSVTRALQSGFTGEASAPAVPPVIAVAAERVDGFAPGLAAVAMPADVARWAAEQLRDPRVQLTVTGAVDGSAADVDPTTRSPALLAADRARTVAASLAPLAPSRVLVATAPAPGQRAVTITLAFVGERKAP